jgi:cellulose synthase/poly-beta-1,6-N-acetylglucosamine synthase-like glycosyltransferase
MIWLLVGCAALYALLQAAYLYFWYRTPTDNSAYTPQLHVLVIVAARNEAARITPCLQSLAQQNYPNELITRVVVNDHSTDRTADIIAGYQKQGISLLQLPAGHQGKKAAITYGIAQYPHADVVMTTDADCQLPQSWITDMARPFHREHDILMAAGPVIFAPAHTMLEKFQRLDFAGMMLLTCAGITGRFQWIANGANLSYRRTAFVAVGGYQGVDHVAGGDDILLMQKIASRQPQQVCFVKTSQAVITQPEPTIARFVRQRVRWGAKNKHFPTHTATALLGAVWIFCVALLATTVWACLQTTWLVPVALAWLIKTSADYILLRTATRFFRQPLSFYLLMQPLHVLYIAVLGLLSLTTNHIQWHQRQVR